MVARTRLNVWLQEHYQGCQKGIHILRDTWTLWSTLLKQQLAVTALSTSCNCRSQTWLVFIFCYRYILSVTILIQFFPFLKCVYIFFGTLRTYKVQTNDTHIHNDFPTHIRLSFPRILPHWYGQITLCVFAAYAKNAINNSHKSKAAVTLNNGYEMSQT
jgi:hypothetical protein